MRPLLRATLFVSLLTAAPVLAQGSAAGPAAVEKSSGVSDADKLRRSTESLQRMRSVLRDILTKLEDARRSKDVVKLNCVNEKLTQIKGLLRISEQADVSLQESVARKEESSAEHEFTKVSIAGQKVDGLRSEAEQCIGQLAFRTDENLSVEVETPTDLPAGDPTKPATPPPPVVRPAPASPEG